MQYEEDPSGPSWLEIVVVALILIILVGLTCVKTSHAAPFLTIGQEATLSIAKEEGSKVVVRGERFPLATQIIAWNETLAGRYGANRDGVVVGDLGRAFGDRAYGKWQVRLVAYDVVATLHPEMDVYTSREEIIAALMYNDRFCARVAARYFAYVYTQVDYNWSAALLAYNRGPTGARTGRDPNRYLAKSRKALSEVIDPFNRGDYFVGSRHSSTN